MLQGTRELIQQRNAVLLAHNYQPPEIQDVADLCGDSLELSIKAAHTDAEVIVFCGVHFMAETASILSPDKRVLLPRLDAGCPMAEMIDPAALKAKLETLPPMPVVTYVNSSAAVKALSTICCTSANVIAVANSLAEDEMLMTPDRNLAQYAAAHTNKKIHIWQGCCPIHDLLTPEDVRVAKEKHPKAIFMAHPECRPEILQMADEVLSTSGMIRVAESSPAKEFIVGTEMGILHPLRRRAPEKIFHPVSEKMLCPDMKKITLEDVVNCLETMQGEVKVPEEIRVPALSAVQRMIAISG